jgi:hypothetical protein
MAGHQRDRDVDRPRDLDKASTSERGRDIDRTRDVCNSFFEGGEQENDVEYSGVDKYYNSLNFDE